MEVRPFPTHQIEPNLAGMVHLEFAIIEKKINFLVFEDFFPLCMGLCQNHEKIFLDIRNPTVRSQIAPRNDGINFICHCLYM
jgi:hypothetical protein